MAPDPRGDQHAWFRSRMDAQALGVLDENEEQRFLEHASQCPSCGEAMRAYSENSARLAREGHIPAGVLARWDRARRRLRGIARTMVREHLATCAECRADLEAIGFKPELASEPEEEVDQPVPAVRASANWTTKGNRPWRPWLVGGAAGAGLATAATLLIVTSLRPTAPTHLIEDPGETTQGAPAPFVVPYVLETIPKSVSLKEATRGTGEEVGIIPITSGAQFVALNLPDLFLPDSTTLDVIVEGPDKGELLKVRRQYGQMFPNRPLLFGRAGEPLQPGDYRLRLAAPFASSPEVADLRFRLVPRAGD